MLEGLADRDVAERLRDPVPQGLPLRGCENVDVAGAEGVAVPLEAVQRSEQGADMENERLHREGVVLGFEAAAGQRENPEVLRSAPKLGHRLGPEDPLARGEVYRRVRIGAHSQGTFEGQHVRRIGYDLSHAEGRKDSILIGGSDRGAGAERGYGRELDGFEIFRGREQVSIQFEARAQIDVRGDAERVALVLRQDVLGLALAGPLLHHVEQHRVQLGRGEACREPIEGGLSYGVDDPAAAVHEGSIVQRLMGADDLGCDCG